MPDPIQAEEFNVDEEALGQTRPIDVFRESTKTPKRKRRSVLMLSLDRNIFRPESQVRARMIEYGTIFDQLHIIVFSLKLHGHEPEKLAPNVWVYPTNSWLKPDYLLDTFSIVKQQVAVQGRLVADVISAQDVEAGFIGWLLSRKYRTPLQLQLSCTLFKTLFNPLPIRLKVRFLGARGNFF